MSKNNCSVPKFSNSFFCSDQQQTLPVAKQSSLCSAGLINTRKGGKNEVKLYRSYDKVRYFMVFPSWQSQTNFLLWV